MISQTIRTHTYFISYKEYKKMCKNIYKPTDNYPTRTHIFFI